MENDIFQSFPQSIFIDFLPTVHIDFVEFKARPRHNELTQKIDEKSAQLCNLNE